MSAVDSIQKAEDGLSLIVRGTGAQSTLDQLTGVVKALTRAEFDKLITNERQRISTTGAGIYVDGEVIGRITGELGERSITIGTGGSNAANAAATHVRKVSYLGKVYTLAADANTFGSTTGAPTAGNGTTTNDGNYAIDAAAGLIYGPKATNWPAGVSLYPGSVTSSVTVPASGDTTGAADSAAIAAAFLASNRVVLVPGAQYRVNAPVTIPSYGHLTAFGATITLVTGVAGNVVRTKSVLPSRTASDAVYQLATGNAAVTSLTANFTSADIGAMVLVAKGGSGGNTPWYAPVTAVTTPTTAAAWAATTVYALASLNRPVTANGNLYQVTTAGTSSGTEPTWPTSVGSTVTDGTVVWTCRGASTAATLSVVGLTAVSAGALSVFSTADRCADVTLQGGTWVVTDALLTGHDAAATFQNSFGSAFRRTDNLRILNTRWKTNGTVNGGGKFTVSIADCTDVTVTDMTFLTTCGDGLHLTGPIRNAICSDIKGTTGDDMTVINCQDTNTPYIMDTEGGLVNVTIRDVNIDAASSGGFRFYDIGAQGRFFCGRILVENFSGQSNNPAVVIQAIADNLIVRNIAGTTNGTGSIPLIDWTLTGTGFGVMGYGLTLDNITWNGPNPSINGIIRMASPRGPVLIRNLRYASAPAGANIGVNITGDINGTGYGLSDIVIDGFYTGSVTTATIGPSPANVVLLYFAAGATGTGDTGVTIRDAHGLMTTGYLVYKNSTLNLNRISINDSSFIGTSLVRTPSGDGLLTVLALNNVRATCPTLVTASSKLVLEMINVDLNCSTAVLALTGAGATPALVRMGPCSQFGAGPLITRDGTQVIRVRGTDIPVDQTLLTPADGDTIYNSNATPLNGVGVAMWNAAASKWKNSYSGTTS